ncbi:MAG: response regulator [Firmicutes bacterium]|nr:response regulator [Bacillota bacterium]
MKKIRYIAVFLLLSFMCSIPLYAEEDFQFNGGGYAVTGQLENPGYVSTLYDCNNGLPASEANFVIGSRNGYIWIASYSGILRYDGSTFERLDSSDGLTSGRALYEDSKGRIWVGTNDNGVVLLDQEDSTHFTYKDGLPSSSIRAFAEDPNGNVFIGTTAGVAYVDTSLQLHLLEDDRLLSQRVLRLSADSNNVIYGQITTGDIFSIADGKVSGFYTHQDLSTAKINTLLADPDNPGKVYIGTEKGDLYYGKFGDPADKMEKIPTQLTEKIQWIEYACGRVWVMSRTKAGYLDENKNIHFPDIPLHNSIEMLSCDYQGNLWFASASQGVMKVVAGNFTNITALAGTKYSAYNATCFYEGKLYVGTDEGLCILDKNYKPVQDELTDYIGTSRIRCITKDQKGNLWLSTFTNNLGLVCYTADHRIINYNTEKGFPSNEVRCAKAISDGRIIAGTNGGLAVIEDGELVQKVDSSSDVKTTVFITVEEGENGEILVGTDGDGMYAIKDNNIRKIGRDDGLTSDVVVRIKKDTERGIYWIITSNSIEYMKDGNITNITTFPFSNNYDILFDDKSTAWVLSSYGIYTVNVQDMLYDDVSEYRLHTTENGLVSAPISYAYSDVDDKGNTYIPGITGISRVNINTYNENTAKIKLGLRSVYFANQSIYPDKDGVYTIPAGNERIRITPAIFDYTLSNPYINMYLEGKEDDSTTAKKSDVTPLEYTSLPYGKYTLHIKVLDNIDGNIIQDETFTFIKQPKMHELLIVKLALIFLLVLITGLAVWRILTGTVIRRQYKRMTKFRDEAERANNIRFRFLANMSEDIRTPINTIVGMNEMILREKHKDVPEKYYKSVTGYSKDIKKASDMLLEFVDELLDMARIESGDMSLVCQEYDTKLFWHGIVNIAQAHSTEKNLMFTTDIDPQLPTRLYGDSGKIKQIVLNLLTNAIKYTKEGEFTLSVKVLEKTSAHCDLKISVKDTGIGIKTENMDKLFNVFEKFENKIGSSPHSSGLGLDISKKFAQLMQGDLTCKSTYGKGSEFIFTLSQKTVDETSVGDFIYDSDNDDESSYVPAFIAPDADILIVDDSPMNLKVIKELLKPTKIFVSTATSGEECLEKIKFGKFHLVLLDHIMPGMDGIETMANIKENYPDLPVYATCDDTHYGRDFYLEKGFKGCFEKPINAKELERTILSHLPKEIVMIPDPSKE